MAFSITLVGDNGPEELEKVAVRVDRSHLYGAESSIDFVAWTEGTEEEPAMVRTLLQLSKREAAVVAFLLEGAGGGVVFRNGVLYVSWPEERKGEAELRMDYADHRDPTVFSVPGGFTAGVLYAIVGL